jgi:hypothetical protein
VRRALHGGWRQPPPNGRRAALIIKTKEGNKLMKISVMTITPDLAAEFLKRNTGNRAIRKKAVDQYADDLRRGEWKLTHQGVAISPTGRLLDGQHRLFAIVQSGITAQMVVALDVPVDAYLVMDRGKPRQLRDALGIDGRIVDACAYIARLHGAGSVEPHHAEEIVLNCHDAILELLTACGTTAKGRTSAAIKAAAALRLMQGHKAYVLDQWRAFVLSDFDAMSPIIKSFYRQVVDDPQTTGKVKDQNARAARAWLAFDPGKKNLNRIQINNIENQLSEMRAVWRPTWSKTS